MRKKIIIIGAGIAGLAAANQLSAYGFEVLILEARDRIGGRIWVDQSLGIPLGRGANWLHGYEKNPLTQKIKQLNKKIYTFDRNTFNLYDQQGVRIDAGSVKEFDQEFESVMQSAAQFANKQNADLPLFDAIKRFMPKDWWSSEKFPLLDRKLTFFDNYVGANAERLSAKNWDEEDGGKKQGILEDAYESLINQLGKDCHIQFNTIVEKIIYNTQVEVITNQGLFTADAVLVTVPLGVLKNNSILFEPMLSTAKRNAIDRLGMGLFNIIALKFKDCFWPKEADAFYISQAVCSVFFNLQSFMEQPILLGYVGGDAAAKIENEKDADIVENIVQHFEKAWGKKVYPAQYYITRWGSDPLSLGSYSFLPVGATGADREILAEPEQNRIFFAGEATSKASPATTHGAYLSGLREAEKIKKSL